MAFGNHQIILQHLDSFLSSPSYKESLRIDAEIYSVLEELTAALRMMDLLNLHRPKFKGLRPKDMPKRFKLWLATYAPWARPLLMSVEEMSLGPAYKRVLRGLPKGVRDEQWLEQHDAA